MARPKREPKQILPAVYMRREALPIPRAAAVSRVPVAQGSTYESGGYEIVAEADGAVIGRWPWYAADRPQQPRGRRPASETGGRAITINGQQYRAVWQ